MAYLSAAMWALLGVCYATLGAVAWANRRHTDAMVDRARRIAEMVADQRWDEARITARKGGRAMQPLLAALREDWVDPPAQYGWLIASLALIAAVVVGPALVSVRGAQRGVSTVAEGLVVSGLVLPVAGLVIGFVVVEWRRRWCVLRGRALTLSAEQLAGQLERDRSEALQRGWANRDPRGD